MTKMRFYFRPASVGHDYADGSFDTVSVPGFHIFGSCCDESHEWYATEDEAKARVNALNDDPSIVGL